MLREAARAAVAGDGGDDGDGRERDEAAARRAHAMRNPHARARTAAVAVRDIDSPRIPEAKEKKKRGEKETFSASSWLKADDEDANIFTMSFSPCAFVAALALATRGEDGAGAGDVVVERACEWGRWRGRGAWRYAGRRGCGCGCGPLWARALWM